MHRIITYRTDRQMSESFLTAAFLSLSGGLQDVYTYMFRGKVFANAQTGNIVLMAQALYNQAWAEATRYLIPLVAFAFGIAGTEIIRQKFRMAKRLHWRQMILFFEIVLLFCVAFIPSSHNNLANAVVSFSCAMQVQAFRKVDGYAFASTMCMGDLRSGIEAFISWVRTGKVRYRHKSVRYFGVVILFALGAATGGELVGVYGIKAIWASCLLLFVSFALMFIREEISEHQEELLEAEEAILVDLHDIGESVSETIHEIEQHIEDEIHRFI